ncbi:autotransporter domain-containing protein [Rhizobium sp. AC27/96]|uniref:autotransporter domain-containing protein n=1 Tax=Rhizobium sp. AC27/96 TaxID=1841653 RepID=UPI0013015DAA|nr:autotransporter domain-containing protein [Rhizobium sp. AC27/96]
MNRVAKNYSHKWRERISISPRDSWNFRVFLSSCFLIALGTAANPAVAVAEDISSLAIMGDRASTATGLSADGRVVAGWVATPSGNIGYRWNGAELIEFGNGAQSFDIRDVSANGQIVVGQAINPTTGMPEMVRWTSGAGLEYSGALNGLSTMARGVNGDGSVIVGSAGKTQSSARAVVWTRETGLSDLGPGALYDVSKDGTIATGWGAGGASIWKRTGNDWQVQPIGGVYAYGISENGSLVAGATNSQVLQPFLWSAEKGLVTLDTLGRKGGFGNDVNDSGVVVGLLNTQDNKQEAFRWTSAGGMTILPSLSGGPDQTSRANRVSEDGSVVVGQSGDGVGRAVLWRVLPSASEPDNVVLVDAANTLASVGRVANQTFSVMEMQRLALGRLQAPCGAGKAGETCYSLTTDIGGFDGNADLMSRLSIGHAFTDNFSAGISFAHSFWRDLPKDFGNDNTNIGGGIYAQWQDRTADGEWYVRGSLAGNRYDVDRNRPQLVFTETASGESTMTGWGAALELGQSHDLSATSRFGYYGGLRHSSLTMDGYSEKGVAFPFSYGDVDYRSTSLYAGLSYGLDLTDKIKWSVNAEIEQDVSHRNPRLTAKADYIGAVSIDSDLARTRGTLSTNVSYALNNSISIGVTPYLSRTATRDAAYGASIGISGKF